MSGDLLRRTVVVTNPQGLHMRPLAAFVKAASGFQSEIFLGKTPDQRINGKSLIHLLGLAAEQGAEVTVEVKGPDAAQAIDLLLEVLTRHYDDS